MTSIIIMGLIAAALFGIVFVTKRRFGLLGLGLAAGYILAGLWTGNLTPIVADAGLVLVAPPLESVIAATLIILPALFLLARSPSTRSLLDRCLSAGFFVVLAMTLLLVPIESALILDGSGLKVYSFLAEYKSAIITICLLYAIFDIFTTKAVKTRNTSSKH